MQAHNSVVAIFDSPDAAEAAVRKLLAGSLDVTRLSVVGKGNRADEKVAGFYSVGGRVRFWGTLGDFWGELWALFSGGVFLTVPSIGNVVVLGCFATTLVSAIRKAAVGGELSVLGAGLFSLGIAKDVISEYESALRTDRFIVMAHGDADEIVQAKERLSGTLASRVEIHLATAAEDTRAAVPV